MILNIYCDTNTLPANIRDEKELEAIKELERRGMPMFGSHIVRYEAMNTKNEVKRKHLSNEHGALTPTPKDEKLPGFHTLTDRYSFFSWPMLSDVQDEAIRAELIARGLKLRDAEHITRAVCNECDVFLTRDIKTIIKPHKKCLEQRFPKLKVWLPSELLAYIQAAGVPSAM